MSLDHDAIVAAGMNAARSAKDFTRMCDAIVNSADQKLKGNITDGYRYERARNDFEKACDDYYDLLSRNVSTDMISLIKKEKKEMNTTQWKVISVTIDQGKPYALPVARAEIESKVVHWGSGPSTGANVAAHLRDILDKGQRGLGLNDAFNEYCRKDVESTRKAYSSMGMIIKNVIFSNPATIVFWMDGTKTVVKCQEGDIYDPEKGLAMAIAKKALGNQGNYCNVFDKWLPEGYEEEFRSAVKKSVQKDRKKNSK